MVYRIISALVTTFWELTVATTPEGDPIGAQGEDYCAYYNYGDFYADEAREEMWTDRQEAEIILRRLSPEMESRLKQQLLGLP